MRKRRKKNRLMADPLAQALVLANKDFNLEISSSEVATVDDLQQILTKLIHHLLDNDFERLVNGLYRIDVNEEKVKQAMASQEGVADKIAQLIIEREMQKVISREKYRK
jgi:hypothetical protein